MGRSNYKEIITAHSFLKDEDFFRAESGTVHEVYLSKNYVIRIRENKSLILERESLLLENIDHQLIPKVLSKGEINGSFYAIENRLAGITIDASWKYLSDVARAHIIDEVIVFLKYLRSQKRDEIYSIKTGLSYNNFYEYLTDDIENVVLGINKYPSAKDLLNQLLEIINQEKAIQLFADAETTLTHGDLIFHNLLTNKNTLTGVLDWELSFYGDPDYDIFRLMNFKRSAKIYLDRGCDDDFEFDYLDQLLEAIFHSGIIKTERCVFEEKYKISLAVYYLSSLNWAVNSDESESNIIDVKKQWELARWCE